MRNVDACPRNVSFQNTVHLAFAADKIQIVSLKLSFVFQHTDFRKTKHSV